MRLLDSFKVDDDHCVFPASRAGGVGRRHEVTDQTLVPTRLALDDVTRGGPPPFSSMNSTSAAGTGPSFLMGRADALLNRRSWKRTLPHGHGVQRRLARAEPPAFRHS
jgi:hypothetical protein